MKQKKILIATGNKGKVVEIKQFFEDLPFDFVTLDDFDMDIEEPEETGATLEENAMLKARYYAEKTSLAAVSDDSGFFIDAMDGWPGVHAARVADTPDDRCNVILEKMSSKTNRAAQYRTIVAYFDPGYDTYYTAGGTMDLNILESFSGERAYGHGYDPILALRSTGEVLDQMTTAKKNAVSSRGNALIKMKRFLHNQFRGKHFVVTIAYVVKDGKLLLNKRNDPHNPKYHGIWEFPGGSVEIGETLEESIIKECKEETGFDVEIIDQLSRAYVKSFDYDSGPCQFYIVPFLCKVVGGELAPADAEVLESKWCTYDEAIAYKKFPGDNEAMAEIRPLYEKLVAEHNL